MSFSCSGTLLVVFVIGFAFVHAGLAVADGGVNSARLEAAKPLPTIRELYDATCGPRCVQFVLKNYHQEMELDDLIRDIQANRVTVGATLRSLAAALEERGIYTKGIRLRGSAYVSWPHPVIVHMKPQDAGEVGHFVVLLPTSARNSCKVWDGVMGVEQRPARAFMPSSSGFVLLTSPMPIRNPSAAVSRFSGAARERLLWGSAAGLFLAVVFMLWTQVPRTHRTKREGDNVDLEVDKSGQNSDRLDANVSRRGVSDRLRRRI